MPFLGVDGGGTKTTAVVVDERLNLLGRAEAGPGNYHSAGLEAAVANVAGATRAAAGAAGMAPPFEAAAFCLAGIRRPPDFERMQPRLEALNLAARIILDHDAAAAHCAALGGGPGVVVIAGTGSFAFGVNHTGERFAAGGWGAALGDHGSAYWIVMEAVRFVLAQQDRGLPPTDLGRLILKELGAGDVAALVDRFYHGGFSRDDIAGFAPTIVQLAHQGERSADRILLDAGRHLSQLAVQVARQVYPHSDEPAISYQGSVFQSAPMVLSAFQRWVRFVRPFARIVPPMHEPVLGAARKALQI